MGVEFQAAAVDAEASDNNHLTLNCFNKSWWLRQDLNLDPPVAKPACILYRVV